MKNELVCDYFVNSLIHSDMGNNQRGAFQVDEKCFSWMSLFGANMAICYSTNSVFASDYRS